VGKDMYTTGQAVFALDDNVNSGVTDLMVLSHSVASGTLANGLGVGISIAIEAAAGLTEANTMETTLTDITGGSEDAKMRFSSIAIGNIQPSITITGASNVMADPATVATSAATGAFTTAGGLGMAKQLYVGGIFANTWTSSDGGYSTYSSTKGSLLIKGGAGFAKRVYAGTSIVAEGATTTEDSDEGALVTSGGAGFGSQVYAGGVAVSKSNVAASSSVTGSLLAMGGAGVAANIYAGGAVVAEGTTAATTASGGSLVTKGGLGVPQRIYSGGALVVTGTTQSSNKASGSIVTAGGVAAAGSIYLGGTYVAGLDDNGANTAVTDELFISHATTGTTSNGIGVGISVAIEDQGDMQKSAGWTFKLADVSSGSEDVSSEMVLIESGSLVTAMTFTSEVMSIRDAMRMEGGTVSQGTNINNAVTLNKESGVITTQAASTAASDCDAFTVSNSRVLSTTAVFVNMGLYSGDLIITNPVSADVRVCFFLSSSALSFSFFLVMFIMALTSICYFLFVNDFV